jgi:uncharacterized membrane protein YdjX (TVP38/TMEM64 family)
MNEVNRTPTKETTTEGGDRVARPLPTIITSIIFLLIFLSFGYSVYWIISKIGIGISLAIIFFVSSYFIGKWVKNKLNP